MLEPDKLPSDIPILQQMIVDLLMEVTSLTKQNQSLQERLTSLKYQLALLKAKRYGKSSEKLDRAIEELEHRIEEDETEEASNSQDYDGDKDNEEEVSDQPDTEADLSNKSAKQKPKRKPLPDHLPRTDVVIPAPVQCPACHGTEFRKISDDVSEMLEYVPASFIVIRHIRPRCACINCEQIVQGYAPSNTIDKGKAGPGLLAHLLVQKYCNHLPFYRQAQMYEREGLELARSTMASWAGQCAKLLQPLLLALETEVFSSPEIHTDDTPVRVLAPGMGKTKTGRIWVYLRDGRSYGNETPPAVCYFYSPDRKSEWPQKHLEGYTGIVHADAYAGYDKIYHTNQEITEAACWAHTSYCQIWCMTAV